jgi:hypothetical protein
VDYVSDGFFVGSMRDRAGQLGESGEYRMGRSESGMFSYSELQGGSPCLCRLRTASVGPPVTSIDYVLMHTGYMGPHKHSSFDSHRVR